MEKIVHGAQSGCELARLRHLLFGMLFVFFADHGHQESIIVFGGLPNAGVQKANERDSLTLYFITTTQ